MFSTIETSSRFRITEGLIFGGFFLISRLLMLGILAWVVGCQELSDDVDMHMDLIRAPFEILSGNTTFYGQHPPFLPVFESLTGWPFQLFLKDFYAIRIMSIVYEGLTALFFWLVLLEMCVVKRTRWFLLIAFFAMPACWMSSVIMAQDEVIGAAFLTAIFWLVTRRKSTQAIALCGFGVVAAKVYLIVPLLALIIINRKRSIWVRLVAGFGPIFLVYGWVWFLTWLHDVPPPLISFIPSTRNSVNLWPYLVDMWNLTDGEARRWSSLLALGGGLAPLVLWAFHKNSMSPKQQAALWSAMLLFVFFLFYHINPEYYILVVPMFLLISIRWSNLILLWVVTALPWCVNIFYGVANVSRGSLEGKLVFADLYHRIIPIDPSKAWIFFMIATTVLTLIAGVVATRLALFQSKEHVLV